MSVPATEKAMKEFLLANDEQFRALMGEHRQYDDRLRELTELPFPNDDEQLEEVTLKKKIQKLQAVQHPTLAKIIEESRSLLALADDWDGEGSPAYAKATWQRATNFLAENAASLYLLFGKWVEAPEISPGPYGSIDLHWQTPARELLVNVPAAASQPATYYGDDRGQNRLKGTLDTAGRNEWLLMWLMA